MGVRARVRCDTSRLEEELKDDGGVRRELRDRAEEAADIARSSAPRLSGRYEESIGVETEGSTARLQTTSRIGHIIEWGSIHNAAHATLRNAASEVADRFEEE
jgi:hypothetical protein